MFPRSHGFAGTEPEVDYVATTRHFFDAQAQKSRPGGRLVVGLVVRRYLAAVCPQWQHVALAQGVQIVGPCLQRGAALLHKLATVAGAPVQVFHAVAPDGIPSSSKTNALLAYRVCPRNYMLVDRLLQKRQASREADRDP